MKKTHILLLALLAIHLFLLINLRFTAWPEMLSYAYLRNNEFLIYKDMIHPYPPILTMGLSYIYSIFGYGLRVLQSVAWISVLVSGFLVFLTTRQLTKDDSKALLALAFYAFLQPFLEGNMLWFDIAIVPPILLGTLFYFRKRLFLAVFFLSVAALIKQTAGIFLLIFFLFILMKKASAREMLHVLAAPLILGIPLLVRLIQEDALRDFLNWTLFYPLTEWGKYPGYVQMSLTSRQLVILVVLVLPVVLLLLKERLTIFKKQDLSLILLFFGASLLIVYPRFSFFHFQPALAFLAVIYGYWAAKGNLDSHPRGVGTIFMLIVLLFLISFVHKPILSRDWGKEARFYGPGDLQMADAIAERVAVEERVYLLGLHSGLYVMAGRLPSERWTDNFGWYLEIPGVQEEIISRWEQNPPLVVFWQDPEPGQWYELGTYQPKKIVEWIEANYTKREEVKPGVWLWERE